MQTCERDIHKDFTETQRETAMKIKRSRTLPTICGIDIKGEETRFVQLSEKCNKERDCIIHGKMTHTKSQT